MNGPSRQRGVALLVALLVVAIAVILVAALLDRGELALARTRNTLREQQAEAYALGLETYAAQALLATRDSGEADTRASPWAHPMPPQDVPGGLIQASMQDLDGCFNLNNLAPVSLGGNPGAWQPVFARLLAALALDPRIAQAVGNWLDPAQANEAGSYLARPMPYRPRGGTLAHVSELRLVRGVDAAAYAKLAPHVCALPPGTTLNVNTATAPLLQALLQDATPAVAQALWQDGAARYQDVKQFTDQLAPLGVSLVSPAPPLDVHSRYFLARGDIVLDGVPFTFFSVIERGRGGVRVLARSRGADDALVVAAPIRGDADADAASGAAR